MDYGMIRVLHDGMVNACQGHREYAIRYDNSSTDESRPILQPWIERGLVTVRDWLGPLPALLQVHDREESLGQGRVAIHLHAQVQAAARIDRHERRYLFECLSVLYLEAIPYPNGRANTRSSLIKTDSRWLTLSAALNHWKVTFTTYWTS